MPSCHRIISVNTTELCGLKTVSVLPLQAVATATCDTSKHARIPARFSCNISGTLSLPKLLAEPKSFWYTVSQVWYTILFQIQWNLGSHHSRA